MKIVLIEDNEEYRDTLKIKLQRAKLPGYKEERDLLEGGLYDQSAQLLHKFEPEMDEKTIVIVDGTLNYKEGEEETFLIGNAFSLVSNWMGRLVDAYKTEQRDEELENLQKNVAIILHPSSRRYFDRDFFYPYKQISEMCRQNNITLLEREKGDGINILVEDMRSFLQPHEGNPPGWRK